MQAFIKTMISRTTAAKSTKQKTRDFRLNEKNTTKWVKLYDISILYAKHKIAFLTVLIATLHPSSFFSGTDRKTKNNFKTVSVLAKIGSGHIPDTSKKCYHLSYKQTMKIYQFTGHIKVHECKKHNTYSDSQLHTSDNPVQTECCIIADLNEQSLLRVINFAPTSGTSGFIENYAGWSL